MFGGAGLEHHQKYGSNQDHLIKIAKKNHDHSVNNPYSQFQESYSFEKIKSDKKVFGGLTRSACCPTSDGAACAIVCSEAFLEKKLKEGLDLRGQAIEIAGQSMKTDTPSSFEKSMIKMVGADMTAAAAKEAYKQAGITPDQIKVVELHDCFASNELITYEGLQLCKEGEAHKFIDRGDNDYGGKCVVNPSGGLISKGHP
jgi:acetyl-CoA acetyltransferase